MKGRGAVIGAALVLVEEAMVVTAVSVVEGSDGHSDRPPAGDLVVEGTGSVAEPPPPVHGET
jgi:hypothetical protein